MLINDILLSCNNFFFRCLKEAGKGPSYCQPQGNRCLCDFNLAYSALSSAEACRKKGNSDCSSAGRTIGYVFTSLLSCWFPTRICFPSIKVVCDCSSCTCPKLKTTWSCINFKFCVPLGSGKIYW